MTKLYMRGVYKTLRMIFVLCAVCFATANSMNFEAWAQGNREAFNDNNSVTGRVVDRNGAGVANASVTLAGFGVASERQAQTDETGAFRFDEVARGRYRLNVAGENFASASQELIIENERAINVEVRLDARAVDEAVTVTVTRSVEEIGTIPGAISVIGKGELEDQSQVGIGIADTLSKTVPGLAPSNQSLSVFGQTLRGRPFQVLIDGIPQSTTRNVQRDLETIDRAGIERVEVLRGTTAIYGDGATGGIINIITRTPTEERLRFSTEVGTNFSLTHPSGSLGGYLRQSIAGKKDAFDFILSGTLERTSGFFDADGDRIPPDPHGQGGLADARNYNVFGKLGYALTRGQRIQFTFDRYRNRQETAFSSDLAVNTLAGRQKARVIGGLDLEEQQGTTNTFVNLDYTNNRLFDSANRLHAQVYYRDFVSRFFPFDGRNFASFANSITQSFVDSIKRGGRLEIASPIVGETKLSLLYGVDFASEGTAQPVTISDVNAFTQSGGRVFRTTAERTFTPYIAQRNFGAFVQAEYRAFERLITRGGARYERLNLNIPDFTTLANNFITGGELKYDAVLFNLGTVYNFTDSLNVFANFSQGFSVADVGRTLRSAPRGLTVNTLRPEAQKVNNYETGARFTQGKFQTSLALFYNTSDLGTSFTPQLEILRAPERIYGAEVDANFQPSTRFRFGGTATLLEGEFDPDLDGRFTYLTNDRIAPVKLTAFAEYDVTSRFRTRLQTLYSGNRRRFGDNLVFGRAPVNDYATVDLLGSFRLPKGNLRFGIENLLNKLYFPPTSQWFGNDSAYSAARGAQASISYSIDY